MNIRFATVADIDKILVLDEQVTKLHSDNLPERVKNRVTDYEYLKNLIESDYGKIFIAEDNGNIVGHLICEIHDKKNHHLFSDIKTLYGFDICVDKEYRKQGVGLQLFEESKKYAIENKIDFMEGDNWEFNQISRKFSEHAGFKTLYRKMSLKIE